MEKLRRRVGLVGLLLCTTLLFCLWTTEQLYVAHQYNRATWQVVEVQQDKQRWQDNRNESHRHDLYSHIKKGDLSWIQTPEDFFMRLEKEESQTKCRRMVEMGGYSCNRITYGIKMVCLDPDVTLRPRDCTVYSFGVQLEISFDEAIDTYGCAVYLMDPTLPDGAYSSLGGRKTFFPIGLGNKTGTYAIYLKNYPNWEGVVHRTIASFDDVQDYIGHHGTVHYLKIDIEGNEWQSLQYMMDHGMLKGVDQIAVEIHATELNKITHEESVSLLRERWSLLERLQALGFLRVQFTATVSFQCIYTSPVTNVTWFACGELFLIRRPVAER